MTPAPGRPVVRLLTDTSFEDEYDPRARRARGRTLTVLKANLAFGIVYATRTGVPTLTRS